ncbi:MAG: hypothetical protein JXR78_00305 [Victivallales bacterium]|nr:hypothetical protein [Victivallales bacterium]
MQTGKVKNKVGTPVTKWSKKRKIIAASIIVLVVGGIGAWIVSSMGSKAPDATKMKDEEVARYMASPQFASLPSQEKSKFSAQLRQREGNPWQIMRNAKLSGDERAQLRTNMGNMMHEQMVQRAKKLIAMTPEERSKEYDRMAEEIKKRMQQNGGQRWPRRGGNTGGDNQNRTADANRQRDVNRTQRMQRRYEGTDSDTRAMMAEMRAEMRKRLGRN